MHLSFDSTGEGVILFKFFKETPNQYSQDNTGTTVPSLYTDTYKYAYLDLMWIYMPNEDTMLKPILAEKPKCWPLANLTVKY